MASIKRERFAALNLPVGGENGGNLAVVELTDKQQVIHKLLALDPTMSAKIISEIISEKTSEKFTQ